VRRSTLSVRDKLTQEYEGREDQVARVETSDEQSAVVAPANYPAQDEEAD